MTGLSAAFISGCEREVQIVPSDLESQVVVEATIESGQPPLVVLTRSLGYFNQLSVQQLAGSFIRGARVTVSDGRQKVQLREFSRPVGNDSIYFYTVDPLSSPRPFVGALNTSYALEISTSGKLITASTTIPDIARRLDSLWWMPVEGREDSGLVALFSRVTDPRGFGNYIRYYTSVNDSAWLPGPNSVFDDKLVDGTTYDVQLFRGFNRNIPPDRNSFGFFRKGEVVDVKLSNIDKTTYDFWRTWEQNQGNVGNPFGVPVKVLGNLSNGAIGYFGGYAAQVMRIRIPR